MKYETAKNLNNTRFKRLIGVAKPVFDEMVKVLKAEYQVKHARGGRKPKLAIEDLLVATLQHLKEYRTYEQIAADYGVHDSSLIRRSHWAEETLAKHGFNIGKQEIKPDDVVLIDATEVKIQRPKKDKQLIIPTRKSSTV
ncbi:DDE endonuclease [Lactobacillus gallinarum]|nr:DDE endonuclease [Lactobacillus gallinarum]